MDPFKRPPDLFNQDKEIDKEIALHIKDCIEAKKFFVWTHYSIFANDKNVNVWVRWCLLTMCPIDVDLEIDFESYSFFSINTSLADYMFRKNKMNNGLPLNTLEYHEYIKHLFYEKSAQEKE